MQHFFAFCYNGASQKCPLQNLQACFLAKSDMTENSYESREKTVAFICWRGNVEQNNLWRCRVPIYYYCCRSAKYSNHLKCHYKVIRILGSSKTLAYSSYNTLLICWYKNIQIATVCVAKKWIDCFCQKISQNLSASGSENCEGLTGQEDP